MTNQDDQWHIQHHDGKSHGPYSLNQLIEGVKHGNVTVETLVAHPVHTGGKWVVTTRLPALAAMLGTQQAGPPRPSRSPKPPFVKTSERPQYRHGMKVPRTLTEACFAIFDFRFNSFITPWIVRIQWALFVAFILGFFALVLFNLTLGPAIEWIAGEIPDPRSSRSPSAWRLVLPEFLTGWLARLFAMSTFAGVCAAALLYVRLILESVIVFFRISEDLSAIREGAESS